MLMYYNVKLRWMGSKQCDTILHFVNYSYKFQNLIPEWIMYIHSFALLAFKCSLDIHTYTDFIPPRLFFCKCFDSHKYKFRLWKELSLQFSWTWKFVQYSYDNSTSNILYLHTYLQSSYIKILWNKLALTRSQRKFPK